MKMTVIIYAKDHPERAARSIAVLPPHEKTVIVIYQASSAHLESLFWRLREVYPGTRVEKFGSDTAKIIPQQTPLLLIEAGFELPQDFVGKEVSIPLLITSQAEESWKFESGESPVNFLGLLTAELPQFISWNSYEIFRATLGEYARRLSNAPRIELSAASAAFRKKVDCSPTSLPDPSLLLKEKPATPKVSVILPSFGRPQLLERALESLIAQQETSWEALIVTTKEEALSLPLVSEDPRFVVLPVENKIPVSHARNHGLTFSRGTYVAYLDNDDLFLPHHLSSLVKFLESEQAEIVYGICARMWEEGSESAPIGFDLPFTQQTDWINLLVGNKFPTPAVLHRNSKEYRFDERLECIEDWDLWLKVSQNKKISFLPEVTSLFSRRPNADGFSSEQKLLFHWYAYPVWAKYLTNSLDVQYQNEFKKILSAHSEQICAQLPQSILDPSADSFPKNKDVVIQSIRQLQAAQFLAETTASRLIKLLSPVADEPLVPSPKIGNASSAAPFTASVIIPLYNGISYTQALWESIKKYPTSIPTEYVFVDNASTDETPHWLRSIESDSVRVIINEKNRNFAGACNQGAIFGRGEFVVFLNNDTIVTHEWLEPLINELTSHKHVGAVGNKQIFPDTKRIHHAGMYIDLWHHPKHYLEGVLEDDPRINQRRSCIAVTGACLAMRRSEFLELGGFFEGYKNGYEDVDLCYKLKARGKESIYTPHSVIFHHVSKSSGRTTHSAGNWELFVQRNGAQLVPNLASFHTSS